MAITFLPSNYKFLNVVTATREVVAGVRYNLLVNASDDTGSNQICNIVVMEKPWLLTEWGDKQRKLDYTNCTSAEYNAADRNVDQNFNFNPVFINQGQGVSDDLMKYLDSQIIQPKARTTKKPLSIDNYILPVLQKTSTEKPKPSIVMINDPSKSFLDTFFHVEEDSVGVAAPPNTNNGFVALTNVQPAKEVIRVEEVKNNDDDAAAISTGDYATETSPVSCDEFSENVLTTTEYITEKPIDLTNFPNANSENNESNDVRFANEAIVPVQTPIVPETVGQDVKDGTENFQEAYRIIEQAVHDNINSEMNYSPQLLPQFVENDESLLQYVNSELQTPEHQGQSNSEADASPIESEFYAPLVEAVALRFDTSEDDAVTTENVDIVATTEQQSVSSSEHSSVVSSEHSSKSSSSSEEESREQLVRPKRNANNEKEYVSNLAAQAVDQLDHVDSDDYKRIVLDVLNAKRIEKIDQTVYVLRLRVGNSNCAEASTDLQACLADLLDGSTKLCNLEVNAQFNNESVNAYYA